MLIHDQAEYPKHAQVQASSEVLLHEPEGYDYALLCAPPQQRE